MCGICGFWGFRDDELLRRMTEALLRRGPDDKGQYIEDVVSLGHRRLSIIDTTTGAQPIHNEDRTLTLVCNGEIYNYRELRQKLEARGHSFYTNTDTEVIIHAYEDKGPQCLHDFNGEFAFALWDSKTQGLFFARDRLGIRPLLYCLKGDKLAFASDLASLLHWPLAKGPLCPKALNAYLTLRYVPHSLCLIKGVELLPPGHYAVFNNGLMRTVQYWKPHAADVPNRSINEHVEAFRDLLINSVALRMQSDIPIAAFLSGGIDSAAIVACMQQQTHEPVKTFTMGGFGDGIDETAAASSLAKNLGTEHTTLQINPGQFELLPQIVASMGQPVGDAIILPTYLLTRATSAHVKVVLSGEGADEILGGYVHHLVLKTGWALRRFIPAPLIQLGIFFAGMLDEELLTRFFPYPARLGNKGKIKLLEYLMRLAKNDKAGQYLNLASMFNNAEKEALLTADAFASCDTDNTLAELFTAGLEGNGDSFDALLRFDLTNWLPDCTLNKQDALGMANSLESRTPFLDHRLVEYCLAMPASLKINKFTNKIALRRAMHGFLPQRTIKAPKKAFYIPYETCFGPKFDAFAQDILLDSRCLKRGIFNRTYLENRLRTVRSSELVDNKQLMALLIIELWMRTYLD